MVPATFCQDGPDQKNMSIFTVDMKKAQLNFILFTILVFCSLLLPALFTRGLFMDGLIYGCISRNLAVGQGTFWSPQFSQTLLNHFSEHPPLAFGLESLFFRLSGNGMYTERFYGLVMAIISASFIALIFRSLSPKGQYWWLPVLLWISTERVFWALGNNMLENTMSLFSLAASYFLILASKQSLANRLLYLSISAFLLLLAFLSKGLPALFPLALPLCFINSRGPRDAFGITLIYLLVFALITFTGMMIFTEGSDAIRDYLSTQVSNSVQGRDRVGERLPFISGFFQQIIHMIIMVLLTWILARPKMIPLTFPRSAYSMFLLGLCAFLPLLISPKLSFYYLIPSMPYFALGSSLLVVPVLDQLLQRVEIQKRTRAMISILLLCGIAVTVAISIRQSGSVSRDRETLKCADRVSEIAGKQVIIGLSPELQQDWTLIACLQRYAYISVTPDTSADYYLQRPDETIPAGFKDTQAGLPDFRLLRSPGKRP